MTPTLHLVVVAKSHEEAAVFLEKNHLSAVDELTLLVNPAARFGGMGTIGNHAIDHGRCDVIGLVHADTLFGLAALEIFKREAVGAVVGMVGRELGGDYAWSREIEALTPVSTLDSCSCFFERRLPVRFDVITFDGFHCCVEDLCLAAATAGVPIRVPPAPGCEHPGSSWLRTDWKSEYVAYRRKLQDKWNHVDFLTT